MLFYSYRKIGLLSSTEISTFFILFMFLKVHLSSSLDFNIHVNEKGAKAVE